MISQVRTALLLILLASMIYTLVYQVHTIQALSAGSTAGSDAPSTATSRVAAESSDLTWHQPVSDLTWHQPVQTVAKLYHDKQHHDQQVLRDKLYRHKPYLKRQYTLNRQRQEGMGRVSWIHHPAEIPCRLWIEPFIDWDSAWDIQTELDTLPLVSYPEAWHDHPFLRYRMTQAQWTTELRRAFHQRVADWSTLLQTPLEIRSFQSYDPGQPLPSWSSCSRLSQLDSGYTLNPSELSAFRTFIVSSDP